MEMEQRRQLATPQQIASGTDGWGLWFLKKSYSIISSPLRLTSPSTPHSASFNLVLVDLLHQNASLLLNRMDGKAVTLERLKIEERNRILSTNGEKHSSNISEQLDLCIKDLASQRQAFLFNVGKDGEKAIKFSSKKESVTEVDIGTLQIKNALESVEQQIEQLEEEALLAKKQAVLYKTKKQIKTALIHLQKAKRMDKLRESRLISADNLRQILEKIEDAKTNVEVLEAFEIGTRTLREANKNLSVEKVEKTMDDLADAIADQKEVEDAISAGNDSMISSEIGDEDELLDQLKALEIEVENDQKIEQDAEADFILSQLPPVPNTEPSSYNEKALPTTPLKTKAPVASSITQEEEDDLIKSLEKIAV